MRKNPTQLHFVRNFQAHLISPTYNVEFTCTRCFHRPRTENGTENATPIMDIGTENATPIRIQSRTKYFATFIENGDRIQIDAHSSFHSSIFNTDAHTFVQYSTNMISLIFFTIPLLPLFLPINNR